MTIAGVAFVIPDAVLGLARQKSFWPATQKCSQTPRSAGRPLFVNRGERKLRHLFVCSVNYGRADYELVHPQGHGSIGHYFSDNIFASND